MLLLATLLFCGSACVCRRKCVLSLDGAGLYAAVGQLVMLRQLEKEVRFLMGDRRLNVASCFDFIVGTGTGKERKRLLLLGTCIDSLFAGR